MASDIDDSVAAACDDEHTPVLRVDPAVVAALILLENALKAAGISAVDAGTDGAVTQILAQAPEWTDALCVGWSKLARDGEASAGRWDRSGNPPWHCWSAAEEPSKHKMKEATEEFATAMWKGRHCVGVSSDEAWLPRDLVQAADYRLAITKLTADDLIEIARRLRGPDVLTAFSGDVSLVLPRHLKLACRRGQSADDYLRKLESVLAYELRQDTDASGAKAMASAALREMPSLDRLHGMRDAVSWGKAVANDIAAYREGRLPWSAVDAGCLLSGPPGCGKTLFARALAETCGVNLISGSYGEWLGTGHGHQGDLLKGMRRAFTEARAAAPSVLFIDEVDSFPDRARPNNRNSEWDSQVVNTLLAEIDGVQGREGVVLVAACNHPEKLDPALVRSGRLDRHIRVGLPSSSELAKIFREHLGGDLQNEDLAEPVLAATGMSGADCERVVRGARRRARVCGRPMRVADLLAEIGGEDGRSEDDQWRAAIHEAGHAVVAHALRVGPIQSVSILRTEKSGGSLTIGNASGIMTEESLRSRVAMLLGGRAAEESVFGCASSGAGGGPGCDLAQATAICVTAAVSMGFDRLLGLAWRGMPQLHEIPERLQADPLLSERVHMTLAECHQNALEIVTRNAIALEAIALALISRRTMTGADIAAIMG